MGIQFCFSSKPIMKSLLLVALALVAAVVVEPEADAAADAWYGYYGHPAYYGGYRGYGYGRYWKREAEAEPTAAAEADPAADAWYGYYGRGYGYGYGLGYRGYYGYARPYGYYGRYWKREA